MNEYKNFRDRILSLTKFASWLSVICAAALLLRLYTINRGNLNYVSATLQRISLSSAITHFAIGIAAVVVVWILVYGIKFFVLPIYSRNVRAAIAICWALLLYALAVYLPYLVLIAIPILYILLNILTKRAMERQKPVALPTLDKWASANQDSPDIKLRAFARKIQNEPQMSGKDKQEVADGINARVMEIRAVDFLPRAVNLLGTFGVSAIVLIGSLSPIPSAIYEVTTVTGSLSGYLLEG